MPSPGIMICLLLLAASLLPAQSWREEVNWAIDRGARWLLSRQQPEGSFKAPYPDSGYNRDYPIGVTALTLYALLNAGVSSRDPSVARALSYLRGQPFTKTYGTALLILALAATHEARFKPRIRQAAAWLEAHFNNQQGLWGYPDGHPEISNSQYAVMGLHKAEQAGYKSRGRTWKLLAARVLRLQNRNGGWGYRLDMRPGSCGSMTSAGMTILDLAWPHLRGSRQGRQAQEALARAWEWLDRVFSGAGNPAGEGGLLRDQWPSPNIAHYMYAYYLYGLERIAAYGERRIIGRRDWYREGALQLLGSEQPEGGWGGLVNTCFALLFLRRVTFSGLHGGQAAGSYPLPPSWRASMTRPPVGWQQPGFDDHAWVMGAAAFGAFGNPRGVVRSAWKGSDIWLRRRFILQPGARPPASLHVLHDDGCSIWLNGVAVVRLPYWSSDFEKISIPKAAQASCHGGVNVLAVHAHDIGGGRIIDVRWQDHHLFRKREAHALAQDRRRWWQADPPRGIPPVGRYVVWGPKPDPKGRLLNENLTRDARLWPRQGAVMGGLSWRVARARGGFLTLPVSSGKHPSELFYAFTWLCVQERQAAILYLHSEGGVRLFVDRQPLFSHDGSGSGPGGAFRIPLVLSKGTHSVLLKVVSLGQPSRILLRLSSPLGQRLAMVQASLDPEHPDRAAQARADPSLFSPAELLRLLPRDPHSRLEFGASRDLDRVLASFAWDGFPRWLPGEHPGVKQSQLAFGARGLLELAPATPASPITLYRRLRLPRGHPRLELKVGVPGRKEPAVPVRYLVRCELFDGQPHLLGRWALVAPGTSKKLKWGQFTADLGPYAGREVLLVLKLDAPEAGPAIRLYLDRFSVSF